MKDESGAIYLVDVVVYKLMDATKVWGNQIEVKKSPSPNRKRPASSP